MNASESLRIVRALAEGVDPTTFSPIPEESPLQNPNFIRAFFTATAALEYFIASEARRARRPVNTGKLWTLEDDEKLLQEFDRGTTVKLLAKEFGRSQISIRSRLSVHGRIPEF